MTDSRILPAVALSAAIVAGCSGGAPEPDQAADGGLPTGVLEALESAARGTPFADDVHPGTLRTGKAMSSA